MRNQLLLEYISEQCQQKSANMNLQKEGMLIVKFVGIVVAT